MNGYGECNDEHTESVTAIGGFLEKDVGKIVSVKRYDESARKYDQYMRNTNYQGPSQLAKTMKELYPSNRDTIKILDVASGTGLSGEAFSFMSQKFAWKRVRYGPVSNAIFALQAAFRKPLESYRKLIHRFPVQVDITHRKPMGKFLLWEAGFRQVDAVDPSQGMLDVAKDKNVYNRLICDFVDDQHQLDIKENTYDAVTIVGGMGENQLPSGAFGEIIRVVKPGGLVVNVTRIEHYTIVDDYRKNLTPYFRKLEDDGKWKEEFRTPFPIFIMDREGIVIVHRILS